MTQLTIIIPFFDETAYLKTALTSVFNQRISDLEVLIVNDNPEHFSPSDLEILCAGFDVKILHHPENLGLSAARNTAMRVACGDWIGFLDADDYYTSQGLAAHLSFAKRSEADVVHAQCALTKIGGPDATVLPRNASLHDMRGSFAGLRETPEAQFIVSSWSSLYKNQFLADNDLWFDTEQRKFEDRLFVLHSVTAAKTIAYFDHPVRVWRRRAGSITTSKVTQDIHVLQIQLLEKCLAHMRSQVAAGILGRMFEKRELFNSLSRLIWDMTVLYDIAKAPDRPEHIEWAQRIKALLGTDSFGHQAFDDPMIKAISRVGKNTRKGRITRVDFLEIHRLLRAGDVVQAVARIKTCAPKVTSSAVVRKSNTKRLVLHLGMHKTGSTYLQHHLIHHRQALRERGVLVPVTGIASEQADFDLRAGGMPGFQGLAQAAHRDDSKLWDELHREIDQSKAQTVIISAENMLYPLNEDRDDRIKSIAAGLSGFDRVDVVALARNPVAYLESFYKEIVSGGRRTGAQSIEEFCVDRSNSLLDMPHLFAPFEDAFGSSVILGDFDQLKRDNLWDGFCALTELPRDLPSLDVPRYPSADRDSIMLLQAMNLLVPSFDQRRAILRSYFSTYTTPSDTLSLLPPAQRLRLLDLWQTRSGKFALERGYAPDLANLRETIAKEAWTPPSDIDVERLNTLLISVAQSLPVTNMPFDPSRSLRASHQHSIAQTRRPQAPYSITIQPKPWLAKVIKMVTRKR
ncbi:glycosyl transferase family 2 [Pacificibacter maritimus]|uniref:Glycosyl transferase family 2 n=1 Tax=Pacificibacter maritimus TaxID=762213 RepID=A0A3N4UW60_9RHOB|nr:glycosyltransferase family 2 protein [Pacificibacter maritimus]RPE71749.1 glycosyl transferase family 2 [Pacificibacter maritimus]